jgi:hypothetical protein
MPFGGDTYDRDLDKDRLGSQLEWTKIVMFDGKWRTLAELRKEILRRTDGKRRDTEAALSARLRDLRKKKFGGYRVDKRRRGDPKRGVWEYQVGPPPEEEKGQLDLHY